MEVKHVRPCPALSVGEPAPWFVCRSPSNLRYNFNTVAGRYVVLCFLGSAKDADSQKPPVHGRPSASEAPTGLASALDELEGASRRGTLH